MTIAVKSYPGTGHAAGLEYGMADAVVRRSGIASLQAAILQNRQVHNAGRIDSLHSCTPVCEVPRQGTDLL